MFYYIQRLKILGFTTACKRFVHKIIRIYSYWIQKYQYTINGAATNWSQLCKTLKTDNLLDILKCLKANTLLQALWENPEFLATIPKILQHKNAIEVPQTITIFATELKLNDLDWHTDAKFKNKPWPLIFYRDIAIKVPQTTSLDDCRPDIKFPWELSRMHHLVELGIQYNALITTNPKKAEQCATLFTEQIIDWIKKNPYLGGVNWVCPMDVAIRATNIIWAFHFFKNNTNISNSFWQTLLCSLYDHTRYLEQNWETSATPNNHYLADLIGYQYLCKFFANIDTTGLFMQKQTWCTQKLKEQFKLQVLPDGTDYEGSTSYHRLVTEFYLHYYFLNQDTIDEQETLQLKKMLDFVAATSINDYEFIQIGDTDSGKLVFGIKNKYQQTLDSTTFKNFGITITRREHWLISQRVNAQKKFQPSGHFHQDQNSITLSIYNQPIIVDPGSFLYTANRYARNLFRSQTMHNGPQLYKKNDNHFSPLYAYDLEAIDLFQLPVQDYTHFFMRRELTLDAKNNILKIEDFGVNSHATDFFVRWNFIFHPDITLIEHGDAWMIQHKAMQLLMRSTFTLTKQPSFYAPEYGQKVTCWGLYAQKPYDFNTRYSIELQLQNQNIKI